jgi:hypothetical protein
MEKLKTGGTLPGLAYKLETCKIVPSPPNVMIRSNSSFSGLDQTLTPVFEEMELGRLIIATPVKPVDSSCTASFSIKILRLLYVERR